MEQLVELPIIPLFVLDGPDRPVEKRKTQVGQKEHYLADDFRMLADAFGIQCVTGQFCFHNSLSIQLLTNTIL